MLKRKGWSSSQRSNKEVWSSPQPSKRRRTHPPHVLNQEESSTQIVRGKTRELLSRNPRESLLRLEKSEETSLLARKNRAPPQQYMKFSTKAPSNFTRKKRAALPLGEGEDPLAGPLPQQFRREALLEQEESSVYISWSTRGRLLSLLVKGESCFPSPPPPLKSTEESLRSKRKDGALPNFNP